MMVNKSTNINKTINYLSPQIIEHKEDHDILIGNTDHREISRVNMLVLYYVQIKIFVTFYFEIGYHKFNVKK